MKLKNVREFEKIFKSLKNIFMNFKKFINLKRIHDFEKNIPSFKGSQI